LKAVFGVVNAGKILIAAFLKAQRQTARRLPEANAGCLSRNRRLFDERNGASHRGRDFKDLHRKYSNWRRAVQCLCVTLEDVMLERCDFSGMKNNEAWSCDQSPRVFKPIRND
jgi:hypothetical protein